MKTENQQKEAVLDAVDRFIKGGDESDTVKLAGVLHSEYRNTQNGFLDSGDMTIISKQEYIDLVANGTFGGSPRKVEIRFVDIAGNNAVVKAILVSSALKFTSYISVVRNTDGEWKVIENFPFIEKVK